MAKLPHVRIISINNDILEFVKRSKSNHITGAGLHLIYKNNGVSSEMFDESKNYRIFTKEGNYVLVTEALAA